MNRYKITGEADCVHGLEDLMKADRIEIHFKENNPDVMAIYPFVILEGFKAELIDKKVYGFTKGQLENLKMNTRTAYNNASDDTEEEYISKELLLIIAKMEKEFDA